jgi:hypothetical protein
MRRRRQLLQVQTFPFLAVLLCTMGALILLLLVIDRRAKAVARAKAEQAARQAEEARSKAAAQRQAEWERKRRQLHALLAEQEDDLVDQINTIKGKTTEAEAKLRTEEALSLELQQRLHAEEEGLQRDRQDIETRRARARDQAQRQAREAAERTEKARKEAARLSAELAQMEQVLAGLKALRRKGEQTYSVVPFSGRRGQIRRPIYVECTAAGVIFHPDRFTLTGADLSPLALRQELDRRLANQPTSGSGSPYLLLLVRPDGISCFYLLQSALAGLNLDFGYELVDQDWVLDFSGEHPPEPGRSWKAAIPPPPNGPNLGSGVTLLSPGNGGALQGDGGSSGSAGVPGGPAGVRSASKGGPGFPGYPAGGGPGGTGMPGLAPNLAGGSAQQGGIASKGGLGFPGYPTSRGTGGTGVPGVTSPSSGGSVLGVRSKDGTGNQQAFSQNGMSSSASAGSVPLAALLPPRLDGSSGSGQQGSGDGYGNPSNGPPPGPTSLLPALSPGLPGQSGSQPATGLPAGLAFQTGGGGGGSSSAGGSASPGGSANSGGGISSGPFLASQSRGRPATPLGMLLGNRDWHIDIECAANEVVVLATGQHFNVEQLRPTGSAVHPLVQDVRGLIGRRQASVRPGEPLYRPILRFRVEPDGLRSYYAANALLTVLQLPAERHNLETDAPVTPDPFRP